MNPSAQTSGPITAMPTRPRVAVVGAGAVGGYFGGLLARSGLPTVMIGRTGFAEAVQRDGLHLDTLHFNERVRVEAATDLTAVRDADLVLFCVKSFDTDVTAHALAPHLPVRCVILSLQNGIENADRISAITGRTAIPAVVYLAAAVPAPGSVKHFGRGDLVIGPDDARVRAIGALFAAAGVGCLVTPQIRERLWEKFVCNCALNAISALCQQTYGDVGEDPSSWLVVEQAVAEILAVARAVGVEPANMPDYPAALNGVRQLTRQIAGALSSTAQDLRRGKRTEIDALNGCVVRLGRERNLPTPVNQALWALVRAAENAATKPGPPAASR